MDCAKKLRDKQLQGLSLRLCFGIPVEVHYDGESKEDKKAAIPFRDLKDFTVRPTEQQDKEDDSRNGNVTWNYQYDAPIFALRVRNRKYNNVFFLNDEDLANRFPRMGGAAFGAIRPPTVKQIMANIKFRKGPICK